VGVELAIVLPTLDEEQGLRLTFPELPLGALSQNGWNVRPLVIDGGSTDRTLQVAAEFGIPVLHQRSRGKGAAIQEALSWLHRQGVAYAVVLDADCTYPGAAISPMVALLEAGSDVVVGVRYPAPTQQSAMRELIHRWGNAFLNFSASVLSGRPIMDLCSGLWGVRVDQATDLHLESTRFEVEAELFVKAYRAGRVFNQIPILYRERVGVAKLRAVHDGVQIFLTLFRYATFPGRRPTVRGEPESWFLRSLLAISFLHEADRFEIHAPPSRWADAELLMRGLQRGGISAKLSRTPDHPFTDPLEHPPGEVNGDLGHALVVTLPTRPAGAHNIPFAVAVIPHRGRLVVLGAADAAGSPWIETLVRRGYHRDGRYAFPMLLSPLQAAHASVTGRRPRQETSLLRANAFRSEMMIFQHPPIRRGSGELLGWTDPPGPGPSGRQGAP
jgi:dolichol-phosphate mannosyltransferase